MNFRSTFGVLFLPLLLLLPACGAGTDGGPERHLVIIGGGLARDNVAVYQAILDRRDGEGPLCVIPTAGASPRSSMESAVQRFDQHGGPGAAAGVLLTVDNPEDALKPEIADELRRCSGYFFTGGQQSRIVRVFRPEREPTPAFEAIYERYLQGAVVSGSSAGAAMMSDPMISGGSSAGALANGLESGGVGILDGLGFFQDGFVDQHFLARGRIGRLLVATLHSDEFGLGFGIDENTALVVDGGFVTVAGESGVVVVDATGAVRAATGVGGSGLRVHLMGAGDSYDLRRRRLTVDAAKTAIADNGGEAAVPEDIFARWAFLHLLNELGGTDGTEWTLPAGEHEVVLRKADGFSAVSRTGEGVESTPPGLTVGPLELDIRRAR